MKNRVYLAILAFTLTINSMAYASVEYLTDQSPKNLIIENLIDVNYRFDIKKLDECSNSFQFFRSFVDYFYLVSKLNQDKLLIVNPLLEFSGWIVGDAHPENFGILLKKNNEPIFTHNDMDDSGPSLFIYDLLRFMVSTKLYDDKIDLNKIIHAYLNGLKNANYSIPKVIDELTSKSQELGEAPAKKKIQNNRIVRDQLMTEVDSSTFEKITEIINSLKNSYKIIDIVKTTKLGGGSGGLDRFEILIQNDKKIVHLELKELTTPAIYPVAHNPIPQNKDRVTTTLKIIQGKNVSDFYQVFTLNNKEMLLRPKFAGNLGINLEKMDQSENEDIIYFEAYIIGKIHVQTASNLSSYIEKLSLLNKEAIDQSVEPLALFFKNKFINLKN